LIGRLFNDKQAKRKAKKDTEEKP